MVEENKPIDMRLGLFALKRQPPLRLGIAFFFVARAGKYDPLARESLRTQRPRQKRRLAW
jgi:hypothetical protein